MKTRAILKTLGYLLVAYEVAFIFYRILFHFLIPHKLELGNLQTDAPAFLFVYKSILLNLLFITPFVWFFALLLFFSFANKTILVSKIQTNVLLCSLIFYCAFWYFDFGFGWLTW